MTSAVYVTIAYVLVTVLDYIPRIRQREWKLCVIYGCFLIASFVLFLLNCAGYQFSPWVPLFDWISSFLPN